MPCGEEFRRGRRWGRERAWGMRGGGRKPEKVRKWSKNSAKEGNEEITKYGSTFMYRSI